MTANSMISPDIVASLRWRYATKKFDPTRHIDQSTWQQIEHALILSPSSFGLQPWKFLVVTDPKIKQQLPSISWNQRQPADCSHLVVICRLTELTVEYVHRYAEHTATTRDIPIKTIGDFTKMMLGFVESNTPATLAEWMEKQCYLALGNLLTTASLLKVDNCPMEGLNREEYDKFFKLKEKGCHAVVMCALGYRAADDQYGQLAKVRFHANDVIIRA